MIVSLTQEEKDELVERIYGLELHERDCEKYEDVTHGILCRDIGFHDVFDTFHNGEHYSYLHKTAPEGFPVHLLHENSKSEYAGERYIDARQIIATQKYLNINNLLQYAFTDVAEWPAVEVYKYGSFELLTNGHHRASVALMSGMALIRCTYHIAK